MCETEPFEFPDLALFRNLWLGMILRVFSAHAYPCNSREIVGGSLRESAHLGICVNFRLVWLVTSLPDQDLEKQSMHISADWNISTKIPLGPFPPNHSVKPVVHLSSYHCVKNVTLLDQCICKWMQSLPSLVLCARPVFGRGAFHRHGG